MHSRFLLVLTVCVLTVVAFSAMLWPRPSPSSAAFPGANGKIAFTRWLDGDTDIYVMNPDGSGQTRITDQSGMDWMPAWSPDGSKIVFATTRHGVANHEIYLMNPDGSDQTRLTDSPSNDIWPSWSPDGSQIAFASSRDGNREIYLMNADGTEQTRLTSDAADDEVPRWSPDGTKIGFVSRRDGNAEIYIMNADGSNQENLTNHPEGDGTFSWSPDGTKIAFVTGRASNDLFEIFVMNADGSDPVNLTNSTQETPLHAFEFHPAWSPDGSKIAFHAAGANVVPDPPFVRPIFTMNADGSEVTMLTDGVTEDVQPDWQTLPAGTVIPTPTPPPTPTPTLTPTLTPPPTLPPTLTPTPTPPPTLTPTPTSADPGDCSPARPRAAGDFNETIDSGGITREYILHVPPSYNGSTAVPLVLNVHGLNSTAANVAAYNGLVTKADQAGFIVVMPQALSTELLAQTHWNVVMFGDPEPDDVGFTADLLDAIEAQLCVDSARIFVAGISNGAQMSTRIGCSLSARIAAIAPVSGVYFPPLAAEIPEPVGCPLTRPVPVIAFHGTADSVIPFDGGSVTEGGFAVTLRDIDDEIMPEWAANNGCDGIPTNQQVTPNVQLIRYQGCDNGATVELYVIAGGTHAWPGAVDLPDPDVNDEISATDLIWEFFQTHPLALAQELTPTPTASVPQPTATVQSAVLPAVLPATGVGGSSGVGVLGGIAAAAVAGAFALGSATWYATRRWGRR